MTGFVKRQGPHAVARTSQDKVHPHAINQSTLWQESLHVLSFVEVLILRPEQTMLVRRCARHEYLLDVLRGTDQISVHSILLCDGHKEALRLANSVHACRTTTVDVELGPSGILTQQRQLKLISGLLAGFDRP